MNVGVLPFQWIYSHTDWNRGTQSKNAKGKVTERSNRATDRNEGDGTDWQNDGYKALSDGKVGQSDG